MSAKKLNPAIRSLTAIFLFNSQGKVLMIDRKRGGTMFPNGKVLKSDRTPMRAAQRLVTEQTGLPTVVLTKAGVCHPFKIRARKPGRTIVYVGDCQKKDLPRTLKTGITKVSFVGRIAAIGAAPTQAEWLDMAIRYRGRAAAKPA